MGIKQMELLNAVNSLFVLPNCEVHSIINLPKK